MRLDQLTVRHPDLLHGVEGRVEAVRALARLIIDLPADQVVALTGYIATRTNTSFYTVAESVIANLDRAPPHSAAAAWHRSDANDIPAVALSKPARPAAFPTLDIHSTDPAQTAHVQTDRRTQRQTR
jgi:hypothetical protein